MTISQAGIQFIASNERFSAHTYQDHKGWSVGYGHKLLAGETFPDGVTRDEALDLLGKDAAAVDTAMEKMQGSGIIPATVTQNQWDSLADFGYNEGISALSQMLSHGWNEVPEQIVRWVYMRDPQTGGLVESSGLLTRREKELQLFQS